MTTVPGRTWGTRFLPLLTPGLLSLALAGCQETVSIPVSASAHANAPAATPSTQTPEATQPAARSPEKSEGSPEVDSSPIETVSAQAPAREASAAAPALAQAEAVKPAESEQPPAAGSPAKPAETKPVETTSAEPKPEANPADSKAADSQAAPRKVEVLIKDKTFLTDRKTRGIRVSFDDLDLLKVLNMDPVTKDAAEKMPKWLKDLNGKKVIIRGFMKPDGSETGIRHFLFVRDTGLCCFGPVPRIYDVIEVDLQKGLTTDYIELRPFDVVGTMRIEMRHDDDLGVYGLYFLDNAQVIRKQ